MLQANNDGNDIILVYSLFIELIFFSVVWLTEERRLALFPLSEILTIADLGHATSRIWTCKKAEFWIC